MPIDRPAVGDLCNGCGLCCYAQICGTGSWTMGLVERYGDRADGPCPAIVSDGDKILCGMVLNPRNYAHGKGGAYELRRAVSLLIGAGAGCDEPDIDDPGSAAKIEAMSKAYVGAVGEDALRRAAAKWYGW